MSRFITPILIFMLFCGVPDNFRFTPPQAQALAPALALPAAIGALEAAQLALAAAAMIGAITVAQNEAYQKEISALIVKIKTTTGDMLKATLEEATDFLRTITGRKSCDKPSDTSQRAGSSCTSSPEACCGDFFSKFGKQIEKGRGGVRVFRNDRHNKLSCCLEWDNTHGGFEIFDDRGNHLGERGCDDLSDDPCTYSENRGRHARPATSTHRPRSPACTH